MGPQFPPPIPNLYGWFGDNAPTWSKPFFPGPPTNEISLKSRNAPGGFSDFIPSVAVIDLLEIPETIEPGEYVLQYRYDSEQTPQVWNTCSDIKILPRVLGQPQINKSG